MFALGSASVNAARAQEPETELDPFALAPEQLLDATVTSVSRAPESIRDAPAAVFVITDKDIARSGATSIPEALRLAPGVEVARTNAAGWAVTIRGFNGDLANKLLVLIDGREVYDSLFAGVYWDIQDTVLEDIARIEVIRGPGASLWGANAVNGVINIITKSAADTQGLMVSALAGDEEGPSVSARYGGMAGRHAHWRVYGGFTQRDAFSSLSGDRPSEDWVTWRGGARLDVELSARDQLSVQGEIYQSNTSQWRTAPDFNAPYSSVVSEEISATGGHVLARWDHAGKSRGRLSGQAYVQLAQRDQYLLSDERLTADLDLQYNFPRLGPHEIIAGLGYRWSKDEPEGTPFATPVRSEIRADRPSGFIQDKIALAPERWYLTIGSKFEDNAYTGFEAQPNVRLQWQGDVQMAWAAVSRALRTPSEIEREYNLVIGTIPFGNIGLSVDLAPNPEFESSEVIAYEAGYRREIGADAQLDIAAFFNSYDGLDTYEFGAPSVVLDPLHVRWPLYTRNDSRARSYGVEIVGAWRVRDNLSLKANYTFLDLDMIAPPPNVAINGEAFEGRSPRHQAQVSASWNIGPHSALDGVLHYVDGLDGLEVRDYMIFNMRYAYQLNAQTRLDLVGQNLFDDEHREFGEAGNVGLTETRRSLYVRLVWRS